MNQMKLPPFNTYLNEDRIWVIIVLFFILL